MSNKKTRQSREVFLDFTMNDDNNLLEQINEVDKSFALNIPSDANKVKHTKVTMANNRDKGKAVNNMKKSNLSIDLGGPKEFQTPTLDDLVKETEELIETISETVQETSKISSQQVDIDLEAVAAALFTTKEELPETMSASEDTSSTFESPFDELDAFPTIDQDLRDADQYTPHFISEGLLKDTIGQSGSGGQTSPFMGDTLLASDLFDDILDEESDVLDQTGSFLFNAKDLHLFSQDDAADEVTEIRKQVDIKQTIPTEKIAQMSELSQKANDLARTGSPEDVDVVEAENMSMPLADVPFAHVDLDSPDISELTEKTMTNNSDFLADEPTVVAKVEDIDILMQKLDELSEKEMLSSLTANGQSKKEEALTIDGVLDDPLINLTNETPEFTSGNGVSKDKTLMSLTGNVIASEINETEIKTNAPKTPASNEQTISVSTPTSESGTSLNETAPLNLDPIVTVVSHFEQAQAITEESDCEITAKTVSNEASKQPVNIAAMATHSATTKDISGIEAEENFKTGIEQASHHTSDLSITQPINLAEIEKMSTHMQAAQAITTEQTVSSASSIDAQAQANVDQASTPLPNEAMQTQASVDPVTTSIPNREGQVQASVYQASTPLPNEAMQTQASADPVTTSIPNREGQVQANFEQVAASVPNVEEEQPEDIAQFEYSFEQVFAQAAMHNTTVARAATEQLLQTDELMNLHEEMKRVEAEKAQALASEVAPIDLEMGNQQTNPLDFPDVYFVNGGGSVSSSAYHATSSVNYAAYLDATTQENNQLSALVNNELHFAESERQEPQKVKTMAASVVSAKASELKMDTRKAMTRQMNESIEPESKSVAESNVISDWEARQTGRTKPITFADTGTTLVDLSTVKTAKNSMRAASAAKSRSILDDEGADLFEEKAAFEIDQEPAKRTTKKTTNQILVIVVIVLVLVILALLGFIIFTTLM